MRPLVATVVFAVLLVASPDAKGSTTRILIKDLALGTVSEITNRSVLDQFHVWAGRGTYSGAPGGQNTEGTQGFIIDWPAGVVEQRPDGLRRYEVRFYVAPRRQGAVTALDASLEELAYVVLYENDPSTGQGYVYLPGKSDEHFHLNVRSIHRGLEGQWLRASSAWQKAIAALDR
jgi:hypothetical protein